MSDITERLEVMAEDREAAAKADDGAINAARALSARDCGALQSDMRKARKEYLAEAFARHRLAASSTQASRIAVLEEALGSIAGWPDAALYNPSCARDMRSTARAALTPKDDSRGGGA